MKSATRTRRVLNQNGFTLVEAAVAMVIVTILATIVWRLTVSMSRQEVFTFRESDENSTILNTNYSIKRDIEQSNKGLISAVNFGTIQVLEAGDEGDTLTVFKPEGPSLTNSTSRCRDNTNNCIVLLGDQSEKLDVGDIVASGSSLTGIRILQVKEAGEVFVGTCGADCGGEGEKAITGIPGNTVAQVTSAQMNEAPVQPGQTCGQPFSPEGKCIEHWEDETFEQAQPAWTAQARSVTLTEFRIEDIGETTFNITPMRQIYTEAGGGGAPKVRTQKIRVARYYTKENQARTSMLIRQTRINEEGRWETGITVSAPVERLIVETLHAGETEWRRGTGVEAGDLELTSTNYISRPTGSTGLPAAEYKRGFHTIAQIRITYQVATTLDDGTKKHRVQALQVGTTNLGGGLENFPG